MNNRLLQFIEYLGLKVRAFETKCGITNGIISRAIKNNTSINSDAIQKIAITCPELNKDWWFTGNGEMLKTELSKLEMMLKKANEETEFWKDFAVTLKLAIKEKYEE